MTETNQLIEQIGALSYIGIFGAAFLANVVVPVPEELVLIAFGYVIHTGKIAVYIVVPLIMAGLFLSDIIMYWLARRQNKYVTGFYNRFFKGILFGKEEWLAGHMKKVIFFSRFLIQLRFLGPFMAGHNKVPWKTFILYDVLAILIYVPLYTAIGWYFSDRIEYIAEGVNIVHNVAIILVLIIICIAIGKGMRKMFLKGSIIAKK